MAGVRVWINGEPVRAELACGGRWVRFVVGGRVVRVPAGSYECRLVVSSGELIVNGEESTSMNSLSSVASRMGLRTSPAPEPVRKVEPATPAESNADRPKSVVEMIGQDRARTQLMVRVRGAKVRGAHPGHVLLYGPPGLGKTSLAELVAVETGGSLVRSIGSALSSPQVLAKTLGELSRDRVDVLFIDEIHDLKQPVEELLYTAMEDGRIEITAGSGANAQARSVRLPPFILVGATTLAGRLTQPFRDRFASKFRLEYYSDAELTQIIERAAERQGAKIESDAAAELARRSRGTARVAVGLFHAAWDYTVAMADSADVPITVASVEDALALDEIDSAGLRREDRMVLDQVCRVHGGGPIGLENLAASSGVDSRTLDSDIEPYLIRAGFLRRTSRGRVATRKAFDHLGLEVPATLALLEE